MYNFLEKDMPRHEGALILERTRVVNPDRFYRGTKIREALQDGL